MCYFAEKGMRTFADWLCCYNNLHVGPGLEALETRETFTPKMYPYPGGELALLAPLSNRDRRGALQPRQRGVRNAKKRCGRGEHCVHDVPRRRRHQDTGPSHRKLPALQNHPGLRHQRSLSMLNEMPCGEGRVVLYTKGNEASAMRRLVQRLQDGRRCAFAVVDIQIPGDLWPKF